MDEELWTAPRRARILELAGPRDRIYFDPSKTKCAIVTCGGLCPGINDVIRAIVMTAYNAYRVPSVLGIRYGLQGFIPSYRYDVRELAPRDVEGIHEFGGTILGTSRGPQSSSEIATALERLNISALFIIGGDGTMKAAASIQQEVARRGKHISIVGIPKPLTTTSFHPHSFGFETAVDKAADAIRCAHIEAASVFNGIGIVKLMGRGSGFIAANASLSLREVNFVLVPEVPFSLYGERGLFPALEKCLAAHSHAVLAVAEGAGQDLLSEHETRCDASGNKALGDITGFLRAKIAEYFSAKKIPYYLKYIDPSYMIRSVPANANDRLYCGFLGQHAVHAAMSGKTGMVVANIMDKFVHLPLELVTRKRRTMSVRSDLWQSVLETTGQGDVMGTSPEPEQHL
ncbi:MAG: ATP-dependent 6-phosphofructokinase [Bilophila wadsworthia]